MTQRRTSRQRINMSMTGILELPRDIDGYKTRKVNSRSGPTASHPPLLPDCRAFHAAWRRPLHSHVVCSAMTILG